MKSTIFCSWPRRLASLSRQAPPPQWLTPVSRRRSTSQNHSSGPWSANQGHRKPLRGLLYAFGLLGAGAIGFYYSQHMQEDSVTGKDANHSPRKPKYGNITDLEKVSALHRIDGKF